MPNTEIKEFAAIDLGSNSFHMIVGRIVNGSIQILSRIKRRVRLADGLGIDRQLNQAAIDRGVECLALFAARLADFPPENVRVVGTYTLRRALNNADFLVQAKAVFPYPIEIISGRDEARLIYAGASHTQPERGKKLVVDIGGGSTEMALGENFTPLRLESRHMGCVSFANRFFPEGKLSRAQFEQAYATALEKIEDLASDYRQIGYQHVLGSSGTIKTVQKVLIAKGHKDGLITEARLQALIDESLQFASLHSVKLAGLPDDRADVLLPGLAILLALFHTFKIDTMRYSDGALREGVIYGMERQFQVSDIRSRTANALAEQFDLDWQHAERVKGSALRLFEQLSPQLCNEAVAPLRSLLKWACQLHEIGIVINHNQLQRHSAYILSHIDLPGFTPEQQKMLAWLVRLHQHRLRGTEWLQQIEPFSLAAELPAILRVLRLAIVLNRARQATHTPEALSLGVNGTQWQLHFPANFLAKNPLLASDLLEEQRFLNEEGLSLEFD